MTTMVLNEPIHVRSALAEMVRSAKPEELGHLASKRLNDEQLLALVPRDPFGLGCFVREHMGEAQLIELAGPELVKVLAACGAAPATPAAPTPPPARPIEEMAVVADSVAPPADEPLPVETRSPAFLASLAEEDEAALHETLRRWVIVESTPARIRDVDMPMARRLAKDGALCLVGNVAAVTMRAACEAAGVEVQPEAHFPLDVLHAHGLLGAAQAIVDALEIPIEYVAALPAARDALRGEMLLRGWSSQNIDHIVRSFLDAASEGEEAAAPAPEDAHPVAAEERAARAPMLPPALEEDDEEPSEARLEVQPRAWPQAKRDVFAAVEEADAGITADATAEASGLPRGTVDRHLAALAKEGAIHVAGTGQMARYALTPDVAQAAHSKAEKLAKRKTARSQEIRRGAEVPVPPVLQKLPLKPPGQRGGFKGVEA